MEIKDELAEIYKKYKAKENETSVKNNTPE